MSQFLIVISESMPSTTVSSVKLVPVYEAQDMFSEASDYYGIPPQHAWAVLDESGDTSDNIFASAGCDLSQGDALSTTELGKLLGDLLYSGAKLIAWYASNYEALEATTSVIELIEYLNRELPVGSGEVYIEYR